MQFIFDNKVVELPLTIIDSEQKRVVRGHLGPNFQSIVLWEGKEYDEIGDYGQSQVENKLREIIKSSEDLNRLYIPQKLINSSTSVTNPSDYKYDIPKNSDTVIVIAYFSPCNYQKPKENITEVVNKLIESKHAVCVSECVLPNADELTLPSEVIHKKFYGSHLNIMFLKENLYNLAASELNYDKFIFIDNDIIFDRPDWFDTCSDLLNDYDIIQPFDKCYWMSKERTSYLLIRESSAKAIKNNVEAQTARYHPGFSWGMTKKCFNNLGGFYDEHIVGGGDLGFYFSLLKNSEKDTQYIWSLTNNAFFNTKNFQNYKNNAVQQDLKIGYLKDCNAYHLYHGSRTNRNYRSRYSFLYSLNGNNYPIHRNEHGILTWDNKEYANSCYNYFLERKEDD